ncbi:MAG: phenylalanine--tRNA ligase subunit beta, partial [Candidatus Nanoarchaeia archaeon]
KANFTDLKQVLDYLFKMLGVKYRLEETSHNQFIPGRVGKIIIKQDGKDKEIGYVGEVLPRILKNFKLKMPVAGFEIYLDWLY